MASNIKVSTRRAPSCVSRKTQDRMVSADGLRWALMTYRKCQTGGGMYTVVQSWRCKERRDGKVITVHSDIDFAGASHFCGRREMAA